MEVFTIIWRYGDGSGCGVVAVFDDRVPAEMTLGLLKEYGDTMRIFEVVKTPYFEA